MKFFGLILVSLLSFNSYSQESSALEEEFIPITIEEKDAFMSTKTGEFVYRSHEKTDATALKTTSTGVIYTDVKTHKVKKGESLYVIAKKYGLSVKELKSQNKMTKANLSIGQKLKIEKKLAVKSSSPVRGTSGKETIVARLRPGQTPASLNAPGSTPIQQVVVQKQGKDVDLEKPSFSSKRPTMGGFNKAMVVKTKAKGETKAQASMSKPKEETKAQASKSDKIVVPTKEKTTEAVVAKSAKVVSKATLPESKATNSTNETSTYTVKAGDTLYAIAKRLGISVKDLKEMNGLVLNNLNPGQKLNINQK